MVVLLPGIRHGRKFLGRPLVKIRHRQALPEKGRKSPSGHVQIIGIFVGGQFLHGVRRQIMRTPKQRRADRHAHAGNLVCHDDERAVRHRGRADQQPSAPPDNAG